jgi:hemerythrin-like metal-binding protein
MRSLLWTEESSVFVPEMDEEHEALFHLMHELRRAVLAGDPLDQLERQAGRLANRAASHFQHEERMMRTSRYTALDWHERQHQTGRAKLAALTDAIRGHGHEPVLAALEALVGWILDHVSVADHMLGSYLRNYDREQQALKEVARS